MVRQSLFLLQEKLNRMKGLFVSSEDLDFEYLEIDVCP